MRKYLVHIVTRDEERKKLLLLLAPNPLGGYLAYFSEDGGATYSAPIQRTVSEARGTLRYYRKYGSISVIG